MNKKEVFKLIILVLILLLLSLIRPQSLRKEDPPGIKTLLSSIVVEESARFHPLLRSGTYNELSEVRLNDVKAYLAVNSDTGGVYTAKNATEKISPASLTKLMTAMISLDISTPSAKLKASDYAASQPPTHLGVKEGEIFSLNELIPAMIMTSANDAATIVGEQSLKPLKGDEKLFVELMNKKSELLGLGKTQFANTQGFDHPQQFSNAYDLVRLAKYAYANYQLIRESAATPYATIEKTQEHGFYHLPNWNALLGTYPGVDGLKIGYTENSGYSTIVTAKRDGKSVIVVVLGAKSIIDRDLAAATLLNYSFKQEGEQGVVVGESLLKPRLDEWKKLRESILEELELNAD